MTDDHGATATVAPNTPLPHDMTPTDPPEKPPQPPARWRPGLPMFLSFLVPGLGQFYDGRRFAGFLWLLTATVGYIPFIIPGLVLHLLAITTAGFRYEEDEA